jgi:hypothetical protein
MPLDNRNLKTGTVLRARYKGTERTCEVVQTADGPRYRLDDGTEHKSPSSAGTAAMDGVSCNGWRFWSIETVPVRTGRKATEKQKPTVKTDKPPKAKKEPPAKRPAKSKAAPNKRTKTKSTKKGTAMRAASKSDAV